MVSFVNNGEAVFDIIFDTTMEEYIMARSHDEINLRDMAGKFLLVKDIDIKTRMLNEPNAPIGKHLGDIVDVTLIRMDDGELKAAAVL